MFVGHTNNVRVHCVIDLPRNEKECDVRVVKFEPRIEYCSVLLVNDLLENIKARCVAQEARCRCGRDLLIGRYCDA